MLQVLAVLHSILGVSGQGAMAGRAVVLRIEPPCPAVLVSRPLRASIVPSLRSADASGPVSSFGPARFACNAVGVLRAVAMSSRPP